MSWVLEFQSSPSHEKRKMFPLLNSALTRYEQLHGRYFIRHNHETKEIMWPREEDLLVMERLRKELGL